MGSWCDVSSYNYYVLMVAKPGNFHSGLIKLSHILYLASNVEEEDTPA